MQSPEINELATALVKAQGDFPTVLKTKTAKIQTKPTPANPNGGSYSYDYADLGDIREAVVPTLTQYGLAVTQAPSIYGDSPALTTTLMHTSGQWIESEMLLHIEKTDAQGQGSAITYARRYALSAILGIVTESDDDGSAATSARRESPPVREPGEYVNNQRTQANHQYDPEPDFQDNDPRRANPNIAYQRPTQTPHGYEHGSGNSDFDIILQAAVLSDNDFIHSLAEQIEKRGSLSDKQISSGVSQAYKIVNGE
jgi:hypothetical protein